MKTKEALEIVGGLSKPSKMPGWAYGLPAKECKTGSKLQNVPGSTCYDCYALNAAMFLKWCKMHNIEDSKPSGHHYGLALWPI